MHIHSTAVGVAVASQTGPAELEGVDGARVAVARGCSVESWTVDIYSAGTATVAAAEVSATVMLDGSVAAKIADFRFVLVAGAAVTHFAGTLFEVAQELFDR